MKQWHHLFHSVVLGIILLIGLFLFWISRGNTTLQILSGAVTTVSYIAWGIIDHGMRGDLHTKVVIEYILIGIIAFVLLLTLAL